MLNIADIDLELESKWHCQVFEQSEGPDVP